MYLAERDTLFSSIRSLSLFRSLTVCATVLISRLRCCGCSAADLSRCLLILYSFHSVDLVVTLRCRYSLVILSSLFAIVPITDLSPAIGPSRSLLTLISRCSLRVNFVILADDLASLTRLDEQVLVDQLQKRYNESKIYVSSRSRCLSIVINHLQISQLDLYRRYFSGYQPISPASNLHS